MMVEKSIKVPNIAPTWPWAGAAANNTKVGFYYHQLGSQWEHVASLVDVDVSLNGQDASVHAEVMMEKSLYSKL
jgi:hypothetical protein